MTCESYIESKKNLADFWFDQWLRYNYRGSSCNAALAIGRLIGAIELLHKIQQGALAPDLREMIEVYDGKWQQVLSNEPLG